jgi:hypothetical protein
MSLDHNQATANLLLDGLAICCFNPWTRVWAICATRSTNSASTSATAARQASEV